MEVFVNGRTVDLRKFTAQNPQYIGGSIVWSFVGGIGLELLLMKYHGGSTVRWHKDIDCVVLNQKHCMLFGLSYLTESHKVVRVTENSEIFSSKNIKIEGFLSNVPNFIDITASDIDYIRYRNQTLYFSNAEYYLASQLLLYTTLTAREERTAIGRSGILDIDESTLGLIVSRTSYCEWVSLDHILDALLCGEENSYGRMLMEIHGRTLKGIDQNISVSAVRSILAVDKYILEESTNFFLAKSEHPRLSELLLKCMGIILKRNSFNIAAIKQYVEVVRNTLKYYCFSEKQEADFLNNVIKVISVIIAHTGDFEKRNVHISRSLMAFSESGILHHYTAQNVVSLIRQSSNT